MRFAYLVMAHNEPQIFHTLVRLLDDPRNDIFVHLDKSADARLFQSATTSYSRIYYIDSQVVNWGGVSQVACELALFEAASAHARYDYYHLLSGVDLPLKTQEQIHNEIDPNRRVEYITLVADASNRADIARKTSVYYPFEGHLRPRPGSLLSWCLFRSTYALVKIQRLVGVRRRFGFEIRKGANWVSITDKLCRFLVSNKERIMATFRHTLCPDELFIPTFIAGTEFEARIFMPVGDVSPCMRKIDWLRGAPYTWQSADFDELISSGCWFARKFSSSDLHLVRRLEEHLSRPGVPLHGTHSPKGATQASLGREP